MSFLTPQEKKRLSYVKDRRNVFRANAKATRKAIPKRKQEDRQNDRRVAKQILPSALVANDLLADDSVENRIAVHRETKKRNRWRKEPDLPLGAVLDARRKRESAMLKKGPNQSTHPTPASGTPPVEQESRHRGRG